MKGSAAGVLPCYLDDSCGTKREKTETESLDLKTEIQLSYVPEKPVKRFLGFLYEGFVPVAGGVEISDIRDEGWGWPLLAIYLLLFSFVFVYLTIFGTIDNYQTRFLSLLKDASGTECFEIPLSLTAKYLGDTHGRWETEKQFNYNSSIFVVDFLGATVNTKQYYDTMLGFRKHLEFLGAKSVSRNVAWTSLAWTTMSYANEDKTIRFYSNADVGIVVGGDINAYWSSRNGLCDAATPIVGSFNSITKFFSLTAPFDANLCPSQNGALFRAAAKTTSPDPIKIEVDARSLQTTIALNFGILNLTQLIVTSTSYGDIANDIYPGRFYIDPHFSSMEPIFCLNKSFPLYNLSPAAISGPEICYIAYGGNGIVDMLFGYPMLQEFKASIQSYTQNASYGDTGYQDTCKCPTDKFNELCNAEETVYTVIYSQPLPYNLSANFNLAWIDMLNIGVRAQQLMLKDPVNGDKAMMELISPITAYSLMAADNITTYSNRSLVSYTKNVNGTAVHYDYSFAKGKSLSGLLRDAWDDVCPSRQCAAVIFRTGGKSQYELFSPVNTYNSQLSYLSNVTHFSQHFNLMLRILMCVDTFSQKVAFDSFVGRSPVQLVQPYFECHFSLQKAFITGVGNAYSNAALCSNVGIAVLGILVVWYVNRQKSIKRNGQIANKLLTTKMKDYVNEKESEKNMTDIRESIESMNTSMNKMAKDMRVLKKRVVRADNPNHDSGTMYEEREREGEREEPLRESSCPSPSPTYTESVASSTAHTAATASTDCIVS
jgi:hypothetical protein